MEDILLKKFFEPERWEKALNIGIDKGISKTELKALTNPQVRVAMYNCIISDKYLIAPPHQALIPKDNGDFRTVYVNENVLYNDGYSKNEIEMGYNIMNYTLPSLVNTKEEAVEKFIEILVGKTYEGEDFATSTDYELYDRLYWSEDNKRYEVNRNGIIEIPTVEGDVIDLPRLYQKAETNISVDAGNIKPSNVAIKYKDLN